MRFSADRQIPADPRRRIGGRTVAIRRVYVEYGLPDERITVIAAQLAATAAEIDGVRAIASVVVVVVARVRHAAAVFVAFLVVIKVESERVRGPFSGFG